MSRAVTAWIVAGFLIAAGALLAYLFYFAGGSAEPSTELTTPEIASTTSTLQTGSTTVPSDPLTTLEGRVDETAYVIEPGQSTASFQIDEVLRGEPTTVVGTTNEVAGQVVIDTSDLGSSQFSDIVVNARTFTTDSNRRDRAIRGPVILDSGSDEHEFITFKPTAIDGLDGLDATPGETYDFAVTGDLTIKGATIETSFDVTVEMVDLQMLEGSATAQILRTDYGIGIPSVAFVAEVSDEVTLSLDFVARAR